MRRVACLAMMLLVSGALAHPGDEYETLSAESGGITLYLTPQTIVVKSGRNIDFTGEAYVLNTTYSLMYNATYALEAIGPGSASVQLQPFGVGFAARVNFSAPGAWRLLVSANGSEVEMPLEVYPLTAVHAESSALRYDLVYARRPLEARLIFVDDTNGSIVRQEARVTARVERWENESIVEQELVPLTQGRSIGEFRFDHSFDQEGAYRVRVASPEHNVGFEDLPPFNVNVLAARLAEEDVPLKKTPSSANWISVLVLLGVALARR